MLFRSWAKSSSPYYVQTLTALGKFYKFTLDTKWKDLPKKTQAALLHDQSGKPQRIKRRKRARNDRNRTNESLSSQSEHLRATHRQTAVELATCPRQCTVALQSNFCRHMYRTVNTQASVRTFAQTSLADGSLRARSRSASTHDTSP